MHLLDLIAYKNNTFISDLRTPKYRDKALLFVLHINTELCELDEVTETINYLLNLDEEFETVEECKEFIKSVLEKTAI